ncbi:MAG: hypothetical protein R3A79_31135 [Nannocystaceae bacterium]
MLRQDLARPPLLALVLAAACTTPPPTQAPSDPAREVAPAPAQAAPAPAAAPARAGLDPAKAEATALRIMEGVAAARELPIQGEVAIEVLDRKAVRAFAKDALYEHNTPEKLDLLGRVESSLGIVDDDADVEGVILDLLEQAVMGIYDPKRKALLIGSHVSEGMLSMVVGHEIAHGLQDMHFDLARYQVPLDGRSDAESARTFLIEGDAQAAYLAWISQSAGGLTSLADAVLDAQGDQALVLSAVVDNPILARMLQLPYADGAATIVRLARQRGWAAVDALYDELPTTSEQMLHVNKLLAREPAIAVEADAAPLLARMPGYRQVWADELGESTLLAMLADVDSAKAARRAAAGWGGDRFLVLERPTDAAARRLPVAVGVIVWDERRDADEFAPLFRAYLDKKMPGAFVLEQRGDRLLFATRVGDVATQRVIAETAWDAFAIGGEAAKSKTTKPAKKTGLWLGGAGK